MTDTNLVVLIGRLTQDCGNDERSFQYVGNGNAYILVIDCEDGGIKQSEVSFINEIRRNLLQKLIINYLIKFDYYHILFEEYLKQEELY